MTVHTETCTYGASVYVWVGGSVVCVENVQCCFCISLFKIDHLKVSMLCMNAGAKMICLFVRLAVTLHLIHTETLQYYYYYRCDNNIHLYTPCWKRKHSAGYPVDSPSASQYLHTVHSMRVINTEITSNEKSHVRAFNPALHHYRFGST